jgi:hypothetical protein
MSVPEQVRKQTEAVQQLYSDLNPSTESPKNGETAEVVAIAPQQSEANRVVEPVQAPAPDEQGAGAQDETFEQKYRTLQGMYNVDVPRLNAENQALNSRLQSMEQLIATVQATPAAAPAAPTPSSLTAEEVDEYGESIDIMRKVSQEVAGQYQQQIAALQDTVQRLQGQVVPRVEQIASQQAQSAEQNFWSTLSTQVPDWRAINDNQDFQSWLLETDPLSGLTRQTYLDDAQRNLDVTRVASFFSSWQSATGAALAQPNRSASTSELEKQVSPGKSRSGGATPTGEARTYTPKDISAFFEKVRTGGFAGKEDERNNIERDIFAAQQDGRIVNA